MFNAALHTVTFPDQIFEAVKNKKITLGDFYLYSCIYAYTISLGGCILSNETIAKEIGFTERGVRKSRANLENAKFIKTIIQDGNHRIIRANLFKDEFLPMPASNRAGKRDNRDFAQYSYVKKRVEKFVRDNETALSVQINDFWNDLSENDKAFWKEKDGIAIIRIDNYNKIAVFNQYASKNINSGFCKSNQSMPVWQAIYRFQKKYLAEIDAFERLYKEN
jgi:hypothetical protein